MSEYEKDKEKAISAVEETLNVSLSLLKWV